MRISSRKNLKNGVMVILSTLAGTVMLSLSAGAQEVTTGVGSLSKVEGDAVAACGYLAYVTNSGSNSLSVIDIKDHNLVKTISTDPGPVNPTFNNDWTQLYFANVGGGTLSIIDAKTAAVIETIPAGALKPSGLRFLPDGKHLVISFMGATVRDPGSLRIMDLQNRKLVKTIPVGAQPERFDITPDGKHAYVANMAGQSVSVVDLQKGEVIETIQSPESAPFNVLVSPRGDRAFVGNAVGSSIIEIDTATNKILSTIETSAGPNGMTFTPDGANILMTNTYSGRMQSYNLLAKVVSDGSFVGLLPGFVRLAPDGLKGVFVRPYGRQVSIFDGTTMQVIENIETGMGPSTVAICGNP